MPNTLVQVAAEGMPILTRRKALGLMAAVSVPPTTVVAAVAAEPKTPSIDEFLVRASASEIAWYHANALAETMGELHPEKSWRSHIDHHHAFCLIVGDERPVFATRQEA